MTRSAKLLEAFKQVNPKDILRSKLPEIRIRVYYDYPTKAQVEAVGNKGADWALDTKVYKYTYRYDYLEGRAFDLYFVSSTHLTEADMDAFFNAAGANPRPLIDKTWSGRSVDEIVKKIHNMPAKSF